HSNVVSSHPVCSMPTEPPPDPAPNHYVTSHHLTLPIMSAESKADNMMSFSHSQTTAVLHAPHLPPQFLNVRLVNPMPVVEQLMGSLTPPTAPHNPPSHQQQQQQQQHLLLQQQTYNSPPQGTTGTGGPAHLLRSPNPPQPVSYHQQQQQHHVLDQPVAAATADYVPNFDYLLPSQVNNTYQQQESQPLPMNHGGVATAVATAASPGYLVKIVPYDQW
uniref:Uncharacterized protein n=1 Tax=Plectus sambesii TaxID=2011161 RepID=A0A914V903_9BILA